MFCTGFYDHDLKVKVTARSKVIFTFIAIYPSVLKLEQKFKENGD